MTLLAKVVYFITKRLTYLLPIFVRWFHPPRASLRAPRERRAAALLSLHHGLRRHTMKLFAGQFATKLMLFATYALALKASADGEESAGFLAPQSGCPCSGFVSSHGFGGSCSGWERRASRPLRRGAAGSERQ